MQCHRIYFTALLLCVFVAMAREDASIDIGAERLIAAERGAEKIAVEIKSFVGASAMADLENALGQFVLYRSVLKTLDPSRKALARTRDQPRPRAAIRGGAVEMRR